jgi:hypothetical protein
MDRDGMSSPRGRTVVQACPASTNCCSCGHDRSIARDCREASYYPPEETGFDLETAFPAVHAWRQRLAALPGWKAPYELMSVGTSPAVRVA